MIEILDRIIFAAGASTDADLARKMGLSQQSIAKARTTKSVPSSWLPKASTLFGVSLDWLYYGRGSMHRADDPQATPVLDQPQQAPPEAAEQCPACPRCAKLEQKLEASEQERREIAQENRQLWKDNATIREQLARMEEYQKMRKHMQEGTTDIYVA